MIKLIAYSTLVSVFISGFLFLNGVESFEALLGVNGIIKLIELKRLV